MSNMVLLESTLSQTFNGIINTRYWKAAVVACTAYWYFMTLSIPALHFILWQLLVSRSEIAASGRSKLLSWGGGGRGCKLEEDGNYFSRAAKLIINQDLLSSSHVSSNNTIPTSFSLSRRDIAGAGCMYTVLGMRGLYVNTRAQLSLWLYSACRWSCTRRFVYSVINVYFHICYKIK